MVDLEISITLMEKGDVIKIKIKGRSGEQGSLPQSMRTALIENLQLNLSVALGGVLES